MEASISPIATLNATHGRPGERVFVDGPGGLPFVHIRNPHAEATVSLHGGQVLAFRPRGAAADRLFLSERTSYRPGQAIRGGIPVCWPWFGPDPQGLGRPNHGLARTRLWSVADARSPPDAQTRLTLRLTDSADTRALWPHAFVLTLEITVGASLRLALDTRNTGEQPFTLTQALHSYLAVDDVAQARVDGLDGCRYLDKTAPGGSAQSGRSVQRGAVTFDGEVDRVYADPPAVLVLHGAAGSGGLSIRAEGSRTAVVWNPGERLAAGMADLEPGDHRRFVCVETANAGDDTVTLAPGESHRLVTELFSMPSTGGSQPPAP